MKIICDVPDEVIESIRRGTWCGSWVLEKMVAKGVPLDDIRSQIIALPKASFWSDENDDAICREDVLEILNDYNTKH